MSKFNLTFSGEILTGADPSEVKQRFGKLFDIEDAERVERFFSGQTITLRRNLSRREAAHYYHQLHLLGAIATLVTVNENEIVKPRSASLQTAASKGNSSVAPWTEGEAAASPSLDAPGQVWAVSSQGAKHPPQRDTAGLSARAKRKDIDISARVKARKAAARQHDAEIQKEQRTREDNAEAEEKQRREEAARKKAEAEEKQRREDAARKKAEAEEKQRREDAARKKAEAKEKQRREDAARKKAEAEEKQRREDAARKKAEAEEKQRREEVQRLASELASIKTQELQEIKQIQAEAEKKRVQARAASDNRLSAISGGHPVQQSAPIDLAGDPGGTQLLRPACGIKPEKNDTHACAVQPMKHQEGEPNFYSLHPFRNNEKSRTRARTARTWRQRGLKLSAAAILLLAVSAVQLFVLYGNPAAMVPSAVAIDSKSGLVILVNNALLMHNRAGVYEMSVTAAELGVRQLQPPLVFDSDDTLIVKASRLKDSDNASAILMRCHIHKASCEPLLQEELQISQLVVNPMDHNMLLAGAGPLVKIDSKGVVLARADLALSPDTKLQLHAGLLFINSADAPAISIYRYEDRALGQQIDEILLLPPGAVEAGRHQIADFVWSADAWWVVLRNPGSGDQGVYRFDDNWGFLDELDVVANPGKLRLLNWENKTLAYDFLGADITRFNAKGELETPFTSARLLEILSSQQERSRLAQRAWQIMTIFASMVLLGCIMVVFLNGLRELVYKSQRAKGAEPIDDHVSELSWIDFSNNRTNVLRRLLISYCLLALFAVVVAATQRIDAWQMAALLLLFSGPAIALSLLQRSSVGNIGILNDRLLLVDHDGMYQLAGGSRVQFRGAFLAIDDVIVFSGSALLPAFNRNQIVELALPLAARGVRVDGKTIFVKLLQTRHPIALATMAVLGSSLLALLTLGLLAIVRS